MEAVKTTNSSGVNSDGSRFQSGRKEGRKIAQLRRTQNFSSQFLHFLYSTFYLQQINICPTATDSYHRESSDMALIASLPISFLIALALILRAWQTATKRKESPIARPVDEKPIAAKGVRDVYYAAFLLRQKLPAELIPDILDYAEYWVRRSASCTYQMTVTEDDLRVGSRSHPEFQGALYHTSPLVAGDYERWSGRHPVRKVIFTITSKDQGWSSYRLDHGTFNNSWTWFEAVVLDWAESAPGIPPRRICTNIHAGRDWRTYVVTWSWDSEEKSEREWIGCLSRGSKIGINVWARFPGWANSVRAANIEIYTAAVR